jgi:peptidoglycan/LPS O-acetylase OafA/YrhL
LSFIPDTQPVSAPAEAAPNNHQRPRLHFLDGIRGVTSLYVMWTHLALFLPPDLLYRQQWLDYSTRWMRQGRTAVAVFIVLSGYCLMLPAAVSDAASVPGGFWRYIKRRARRIFPPYYAALTLSLVLLAFFAPRLKQEPTFWTSMLPISPGAVVSHLLMLHNINEQWITRIDAPMWSVATEWQIYFLFALAFLPLFRRSFWLALTAAVAIGLAPMFFLHRGEGASPWFGVLFVFGMVGASICHSAQPRWNALRSRLGDTWGGAFALGVLVSTAWHLFRMKHTSLLWKGEFIEDAVLGLTVMAGIIWCTRSIQSGRPNAAVKLLEAPPLLFLGAISYSLYLFHVPILGTLDMLMRSAGAALPGTFAASIYLFGGTALTIGITYPLYRLFEKPFVNR